MKKLDKKRRKTMKATIKATPKEIAALIIELQGRQAAPAYETFAPELKLSLNPKATRDTAEES